VIADWTARGHAAVHHPLPHHGLEHICRLSTGEIKECKMQLSS